MTFDWIEFLDRHDIDYLPKGRHWVHTFCPWCDPGDSRHFLISINLDSGKGWHCWKNPDHHGGPIKLVAAMLSCSMQEASRIVGQHFESVSGHDLEAHIQALLKKRIEPITQSENLILPAEFQPFANSAAARPFLSYLRKRGFTLGQILHFTEDYDIYFCRDGPQRYRVVFTAWLAGRLAAWTGRSISPTEHLRYKSSSSNTTRPITDCLLWLDQLKNSDMDTIVLCEGPFDALKVQVLGKSMGIAATCFTTTTPSPNQLELLHQLLPHFRRRILLLDRQTEATAICVLGQLAGLRVVLGTLPAGVKKDPGDFDQATFSDWIQREIGGPIGP